MPPARALQAPLWPGADSARNLADFTTPKTNSSSRRSSKRRRKSSRRGVVCMHPPCTRHRRVIMACPANSRAARMRARIRPRTLGACLPSKRAPSFTTQPSKRAASRAERARGSASPAVQFPLALALPGRPPSSPWPGYGAGARATQLVQSRGCSSLHRWAAQPVIDSKRERVERRLRSRKARLCAVRTRRRAQRVVSGANGTLGGAQLPQHLAVAATTPAWREHGSKQTHTVARPPPFPTTLPPPAGAMVPTRGRTSAL